MTNSIATIFVLYELIQTFMVYGRKVFLHRKPALANIWNLWKAIEIVWLDTSPEFFWPFIEEMPWWLAALGQARDCFIHLSNDFWHVSVYARGYQKVSAICMPWLYHSVNASQSVNKLHTIYAYSSCKILLHCIQTILWSLHWLINLTNVILSILCVAWQIRFSVNMFLGCAQPFLSGIWRSVNIHLKVSQID